MRAAHYITPDLLARNRVSWRRLRGVSTNATGGTAGIVSEGDRTKC